MSCFKARGRGVRLFHLDIAKRRETVLLHVEGFGEKDLHAILRSTRMQKGVSSIFDHALYLHFLFVWTEQIGDANAASETLSLRGPS
jgi:hypothetical protein